MRPSRAALAAVLALGLALSWGCAGVRTRSDRRFRAVPVPARNLVRAARSQMGVPYAYGGSEPRTGFDCSGLVFWCYRRCGGRVPRTAWEQFHVGTPVPRARLRAGDLVFFATASGGHQPSHVGIMVNHRWFIHAPAAGQYVRLDELDNNYWRRTYYGARRVE